jgi:phage terminase large subunit
MKQLQHKNQMKKNLINIKLFTHGCTPLVGTLINCTSTTVINQGGTASAKTWAILQTLFTKAVYKRNQVITIVSESIPNLKRGALRDAIHIINTNPELKKQVMDYNRSDRVITFKSGSVMEFNSYLDEQGAKSGKRDYLFLNEANGVQYEIYWQLAIRTRKQRFIDYNPTAAFWVHDKLIGQPDTEFFRTTHRTNPFLSSRQHAEIEAIQDPELRKVYTYGLTGNIRGLIYRNWKPVERWPDVLDEIIWGLDFGYTTDPTALVKIGIVKPTKTIYLKECSYLPGIEPEELKKLILLNGGDNSDPVYCDHDKEMISKLRRLGVNARMAMKTETDKKAGILKLQTWNVFYMADSENLKFEVNRYKWRVIDGVTMNKPDESTPDHCFVGSTKITTDKGLVNISDIKIGDYVLTTGGFRKVLNSIYSGVKVVNIYRIDAGRYANNIYLCCTDNHKFKINNSWKEISKLKQRDVITLNKSLTVKLTDYTQMKNIFRSIQQDFIRQFGSTIAEKSQMDIAYIILTMILGIMKLKIWLLSKFQNMQVIIQGNFIGKIKRKLLSIWIRSGQKQANGTGQKKGLSGIKNTQKNLILENLILEKLFAWFVKKNLPKKTSDIHFAQINAKVNIEGILRLISSSANVKSVVAPSEKINIVKLFAVLHLAVQNVHGEPGGLQKVYDLTVDENHEFFANDVLVHNCLDSSRYGVHSHLFRLIS